MAASISRHSPPLTGEIGGAERVPTSSLGDTKLRRRLVARDIDALGDVYDLYASVVYGVALQVTADRGLAEAATQVVFLELWRRPERFEPDHGPLRPWLAEQAHHWGVLARRRGSASGSEQEHAAGENDQVIDIDEAVQSVLKTEEVRGRLAALPDDERDAIRFAYFGGKTYSEVADDLGVPADTIKARMHSGLRRMADPWSHADGPGQEASRGT
jgi:RNA polymerase sigma factor (sigma-70 family)